MKTGIMGEPVSPPAKIFTITVPIEEIVNGPKKRKMDLAHIQGLGFFVTEQPCERVLYFDDIRLLQ